MMRVALLLLILPLLPLFAACGDDTTPAGDTSGDTSPDTTEPGPFAFGPCPRAIINTRLDCATLRVPVDGGAPDEHATLHLTRSKALEPSNRVGVLLVNPGGPGSPSNALVDAMSTFAPYFDVSNYFDIIGVDWRGTGFSQPRLSCLADAEIEALQALHPVTDLSETIARVRQMLVDCRAEFGDAFMASLDTTTAARDLEAVRVALGEERLNFYGASYGSQLGAVYASLYPDRVRAFVIDAPITPGNDLAALMTGQTEGYADALERFFAYCGAEPSCPFEGGTGAEAVEAAFDAVMAYAYRDGIPADDDRILTPYDFETAMFRALVQGLWDTWAAGLTAAQAGDGTPLLAMTESSRRRRPDGSYDSTLEPYVTILCADMMAGERPDQTSFEAALDAADAAWPRFQGGGRSFIACYDWDNPNTPVPVDASGAPPMLIVAGQNDAATPLPWAYALQEALGNGSHILESPHEGHVTWGRGDRTVENRIRDFLIDPSRTHDRWSCVQTMPPAETAASDWGWVDISAILVPASTSTTITAEVIRRDDGEVLATRSFNPNVQVRIEVPTEGAAQDLFVRLSADGYRQTEHHRLTRLRLGWTIETSLITDAELARIYGGVGLDNTRGMLIVDGKDCDGQPIDGATFSLSPAGSEQVLYSRQSASGTGCTYSASATSTDDCSDALVFNMNSGTYTPQYQVPGGPAINGPAVTLDRSTVHFVSIEP